MIPSERSLSVRITVIILILLISYSTFAHADGLQAIAKQLRTLLDKHDILIIGENHRKEESTRLISALTADYLETGKCLSVALEINSDQQPTIDSAMSGITSIHDIKISSIIDHPEYREMLSRFLDLKTEGKCLKVVAVDGFRQEQSRDEWMAANLEPLLKGKVLFLVGNLHAIKRIRWESGKLDPFVAERLVAKGYDVCSVMQAWDGREGLTELTLADVAQVLDPVAALMPSDTKEFGDYSVHWH